MREIKRPPRASETTTKTDGRARAAKKVLGQRGVKKKTAVHGEARSTRTQQTQPTTVVLLSIQRLNAEALLLKKRNEKQKNKKTLVGWMYTQVARPEFGHGRAPAEDFVVVRIRFAHGFLAFSKTADSKKTTGIVCHTPTLPQTTPMCCHSFVWQAPGNGREGSE